jgi:hypothetical protein
MNGAKLWPIAVVSVLAVTVAANVVLLVQAGDPDAAGIEPDYYRRAVAWDSTLAQERRNISLGWQLAAELGVATPAGTPLIVRLTGPDGVPRGRHDRGRAIPRGRAPGARDAAPHAR